MSDTSDGYDLRLTLADLSCALIMLVQCILSWQFQRLVREVAKDMSSTFQDFRFQPCALEAMQEAAEAYLVTL